MTWLALARTHRRWAAGVAAAALLTMVTTALLLRNRPPGAPLPTFSEVGISVVVTDVVVGARISADGGPATAVLIAPTGEEVASVHLQPRESGDGQSWTEGTLEDIDGEPVTASPGDRLIVDQDKVRSAAEIPQLELRVDRLGGRVEGTTLPGSSVAVMFGAATSADSPVSQRVRHAGGNAGSSGAFALVASPEGPLTGPTPMTVTVSAPSGLQRTVVRSVPYVRVSLLPGDVSGNMNPYDEIHLELFGSNENLTASARVIADSAGRYTVWLRGDNGERVRPAPGDRVEVSDRSDRLTLLIPPLSGEYDEEGKRLVGDAAAGSTVSLVAWNPWFPGLMEPATTAESTGRWALDLEDGLKPASHYYLTERMNAGDEITLCRQRPFVQLVPGSPALTVEALWDTEADLQLSRAGMEVATAAGAGPWSGDIKLTWKDALGHVVDALPGDVVTGVVNRWPVSFTVGGLEAAIHSGTARLEGLAPPGAKIFLGWRSPWEQATAGSDGKFRFDVGDHLENGALAGGTNMEVGYAVSEGHHMRQPFAGVTVSVSLTAGIITGVAQPNSPVEIRLKENDGVQKGAVNSVADAHGRVSTGLPTGVAALAPGDRVEFQAGVVSSTLEIPAFTAAFDAETGTVAGIAPPESMVSLSVFIGDSRQPEDRYVIAGKDGAWTVDLRLPRPGQALLDPATVSSIDVVLDLEENTVTLSLEGPRAQARSQHRAWSS